MNSQLKIYGGLIIALIFAVAILGTTFIANGSEYEDAWLYIVALYFVVNGIWMTYATSNKEN